MKAIWAALAFVAMAGLVGVPGAGAQPAVAASAPATGLPPAELFFRHPDFQTARLSPSGRWLAASVGLANGRFGLGVFDLSGATPPAVVAHFRDTDIGYFNWVSDARLVYNVVDLERGSGDPRYAPGLFSVTRDGSETRHLVKMRRDFITGPPRTGDRTLPANHTLLHVPAGEGDEVIVGEWMFSRWRELEALVPKRLNIVTGQVSSIAHGMPSGATGWLFDASGKPRVALVQREGRLSIHWRAQLEGDAAPALGRDRTLRHAEGALVGAGGRPRRPALRHGSRGQRRRDRAQALRLRHRSARGGARGQHAGF